jgi:hypothetical protein
MKCGELTTTEGVAEVAIDLPVSEALGNSE